MAITTATKLIELGMVSRLALEVMKTDPGAKLSGITAIATADATDLPTAIALANATKAKVNAMIAAFNA